MQQPVNVYEPDEEVSSLVGSKPTKNTDGSLFQRDYRYYLFHDQEATQDGEPDKENTFINEVIEMVISPIHKNYQRQLNRLSMKEKRLSSPGASSIQPVPFNMERTSFEEPVRPPTGGNSNAFLWHLNPDEYKRVFPGPLSAPLDQIDQSVSPPTKREENTRDRREDYHTMQPPQNYGSHGGHLPPPVVGYYAQQFPPNYYPQQMYRQDYMPPSYSIPHGAPQPHSREVAPPSIPVPSNMRDPRDLRDGRGGYRQPPYPPNAYPQYYEATQHRENTHRAQPRQEHYLNHPQPVQQPHFNGPNQQPWKNQQQPNPTQEKKIMQRNFVYQKKEIAPEINNPPTDEIVNPCVEIKLPENKDDPPLLSPRENNGGLCPSTSKSHSSSDFEEDSEETDEEPDLDYFKSLSFHQERDIQRQQELKSQLQLSPNSKQQFQDFFKVFKEKEKEGGFRVAKEFVKQNIKVLPEKIHWKIFLELADLAKREKYFNKAKKYYMLVNEQQPYAGKGWLEYAKMEEESGNLEECTRILADGLAYCPHHEGLLVKGIKHNEKMGTITEARALLGRLKNVAIDRSWRTIMEGGMLEARQGNIQIARQIFKYLMEKVPLYGPIYTEAIRLEIKMEDYQRGMYLVEKGLSRIPSYGPLWFLALKLEERLNGDYKKRVQAALPRLSKELVWKIWFELAQIEERNGNRADCYDAYVKAVVSCPKNLLWKVWLGGARTEIQNKNNQVVEELLKKADQDVPSKMRATVLVDLARYQEYIHHLDEARRILEQAKIDSSHEWKVFLEAILLEIRANNLQKALYQVQEALKIHSSTGRLWAILIQLTHLIQLGSNNVENETNVFLKAMNTVPKSGEVWCEGARLALHQNLLEHAKRYLAFAVQFTPQYGDSFVEYLRIEMLIIFNSLKPGESITDVIERSPHKEAIDKIELLCVNAEPTYGVCWAYCRDGQLDSSRRCFKNAKEQLINMAQVAQQIKEGTFKESLSETQKLIYHKLDIAAYLLGVGLNTNSQNDEFRFKTIFH